MSYFLFGDFESSNVTDANVASIKKMAKGHELLVWFNDDITDEKNFVEEFNALYPDAKHSFRGKPHDLLGSYNRSMFDENPRLGNKDVFLVTSFDQPPNSEDVLDVWERYPREVLFPNGDKDRTVFDQCCAQNLERLNAVLSHLIEVLHPASLRVFVDGCGEYAPTRQVTVDEMIDDLVQQLTGTPGSIDSAIYDIRCQASLGG
jgi:hypothetical protein